MRKLVEKLRAIPEADFEAKRRAEILAAIYEGKPLPRLRKGPGHDEKLNVLLGWVLR